MKDIILSIKDLSKRYGSIRALDHLDLEVEQGSVFGILGPNGSGKTTTLGILLDILKPDSGSFSWFGKVSDKESRKKIGAILEVPVFYPYLTAYQNLQLLAKIKELPGDDIEQALQTVGLAERKFSKYKTYSLGMKQRLAIAATLLGNPEVMILDEPTNGLDPRGIADIRNIILDIASRGITIIIASHILDEVQKICSHVAVLEKGKKLYAGKVSEVLGESQWVELAAEDMQKLLFSLRKFPDIGSIQEEGDRYIVKLADHMLPSELNRYLFDNGIVLTHLASRKKSLEKYFLDLLDKK